MRAIGSNLTNIFLFIFILFMTSSCSKESYNPVPDVYINLTIPANDQALYGLAPTTSITLTSDTRIDWGASTAGYDGNGIILYYDPNYGISAYDGTCPYCYEVSNLSKAVISDGSCFAVCPECGTNYALPSSGAPFKGPGTYCLKNYHAELYYGAIRIWNKNN